MIAEDSMIPSETLGRYVCPFCYDKGLYPGQIFCDTCVGVGQREYEQTVSASHDPGEPVQEWGKCDCEECETRGYLICGECDGTGELPFVSCLVGIEDRPKYTFTIDPRLKAMAAARRRQAPTECCSTNSTWMTIPIMWENEYIEAPWVYVCTVCRAYPPPPNYGAMA